MKPIFIEVDEHEALPDGCFMKFSALGPARPISRIQAEPPDGQNTICVVEGRDENDHAVPAWGAPVDDSSAGQSWLVGGGAHGLRLRPESGGEEWAEAYLLLSPESIVEPVGSTPKG